MNVPDYIIEWGKKFLMSREEYYEFMGWEIKRPVKRKKKVAVEAKIEEKPKPIGYVYIMKSGSSYKIGLTRNSSQRLVAIKRLFPLLKLVHNIACVDAGKVETYLHKKYKSKRIAGEWYKLDKQDLEWLKSLPDYSLDEAAG